MKTNILFLGLLLSLNAISHANLLLDEPFAYPDGPIVGAAGSPWVHHSGSITGEVDVAAQRLFLTQKEGEDINAALAGAPYSVTNPAALYASFTARFTSLPTKAGSYFAHFKDASSGFRARLFASTNYAAPGCFRLGIANGSNDPAAATQASVDLRLNEDYLVVIRYDVPTCASALWLNPTSEADPAVLAADTATTNAVTSFAFRQSLSSGSGMGELFVSQLRVATTFAEALPASPASPPVGLAASWSQTGVEVTFTGDPGRSYVIESTDDLTGWTLRDTLQNVSGTVLFTDGTTVGVVARFYRVRLLE